jgi:hypothetical protein
MALLDLSTVLSSYPYDDYECIKKRVESTIAFRVTTCLERTLTMGLF